MPLATELTSARYVSFTTFRKSGKAVSTPVWAADDGRYFYVFSEGNAGKVKRVRNAARAQLAPCTVTGNVTGNQFDANAELITDPTDIANAYVALRRKYGWQMHLIDFISKFGGRYHQRALIRIAVTD